MKLSNNSVANFPKPILHLFCMLWMCLFYSTTSLSQTIITFPFGNVTVPTYSDSGLSSVSNITPGPGITVVNCPPWLSATGWNQLFAADANAAGQYWEFSIDVASGYQLNINEIEVISRASDTTFSRVAGHWWYQEGGTTGTWSEASTISSMQGVGRNDICLLGARSRRTPLTISATGRIYFRLIHFRAENNQTRVGAIEVRGTTVLALPVELMTFEAKSNESGVLLNWETSSELTNEGFEIQRLNDERQWEIIGWEEGHGTTTAQNSYHFEDQTPFPGDNFYRLKQIDTDGAYAFSEVVSAKYEQSTPELTLFPNPGNGPFEINVFNPDKKKMRVRVLDLVGQNVWESPLIEDQSVWKKQLDLPPNRQYLLHLQIGQKVLTRLIVVNDLR